jgi:ribosomal-protein-alanine N-acetyltransferase
MTATEKIESKPWQVRPLRAGDVEPVFELERRTEDAAHWSEEEYLRMVEPPAARGVQRIACVAVVQGGVVGFAAGRVVLNEAEIENVAVELAYRRRGVAASLVRGLLEECRRKKASVVRLEVRESNVAAQALYAAAGFTQEARRERYYRSPEEAALVLMRKL